MEKIINNKVHVCDMFTAYNMYCIYLFFGRVIGTASNFEEFANVFQCPAGTRMNPTKRCSVW